MRISVVIPCYNSSKTIEVCVESVFKQTFLPYEIIIVDDGSSDGTHILLEKLRNIKPKDLLFKVIKQDNSGPSVARNNGIDAATGDLVAFLDSDDEWEDVKLEMQVEYFKSDPLMYLCGTAYNFKYFDDKITYKEIEFKDLLYKNYFPTPSVVVKRDIFKEKIKFDPNQKYSEDYKLWLLITFNYRAIYVNSILSKSQNQKYAFGESGLSANLWEMQKGELNNYLYLNRVNKISLFTLVTTSLYSMVKFIRRCLIVKMKKL